MNSPALLSTAILLEHARAAARDDEARHSACSPSATTTQANERTLLGWGGAAMLDLEWTNRVQFNKSERNDYRRAYADEYLLRRLERRQTAALLPGR